MTNDAHHIVADDGEIIGSGVSVPMIDNGALATIARVEIDQQVATARQFPRSIDRAVKNIIALATLDEDTAESCCYALVRKSKKRGRGGADDGEDNKPIEGPSIRLAEIALTQWGNCRADARVVEINRADKYVAAEGVFHDLETNVAIKKTVRRRISTKSGFVFSDDMITVTGNAACSIAFRNAVLSGIPRGIYLPAYNKARQIIAGTAETLVANRAKAIGAFARFGVTPEQLFDALDVEGEGDIKPSHIATLRSMFSTLKNGESSVEEMFGKPEPDHKIVENALADEPEKETPPAAQAHPDHGTGEASVDGEGEAHRRGHAAGHQPAATPDGAAPQTAEDDQTGELEGAREDTSAAKGQDPSAEQPSASASPKLLKEAEAAAAKGRRVFDRFWSALESFEQSELKPHMPTLMAMANKADGRA